MSETDPRLLSKVTKTHPSSVVVSRGYRDQLQRALVGLRLGHGPEEGWHRLHTPRAFFVGFRCCHGRLQATAVLVVGAHRSVQSWATARDARPQAPVVLLLQTCTLVGAPTWALAGWEDGQETLLVLWKLRHCTWAGGFQRAMSVGPGPGQRRREWVGGGLRSV